MHFADYPKKPMEVIGPTQNLQKQHKYPTMGMVLIINYSMCNCHQ